MSLKTSAERGLYLSVVRQIKDILYFIKDKPFYTAIYSVFDQKLFFVSIDMCKNAP